MRLKFEEDIGNKKKAAGGDMMKALESMLLKKIEEEAKRQNKNVGKGLWGM